jgi:hypothetical protein
MSLIPCTEDCVYQKDGCCALERASSKGRPKNKSDGCIHYIKRVK